MHSRVGPAKIPPILTVQTEFSLERIRFNKEFKLTIRYGSTLSIPDSYDMRGVNIILGDTIDPK